MAKAEHCRRFSYVNRLSRIEPKDAIDYGWWMKRTRRYEYWASVVQKCINKDN